MDIARPDRVSRDRDGLPWAAHAAHLPSMAAQPRRQSTQSRARGQRSTQSLPAFASGSHWAAWFRVTDGDVAHRAQVRQQGTLDLTPYAHPCRTHVLQVAASIARNDNAPIGTRTESAHAVHRLGGRGPARLRIAQVCRRICRRWTRAGWRYQAATVSGTGHGCACPGRAMGGRGGSCSIRYLRSRRGL